MRLGFMGSPDFAVPALRSLLAAGHRVAAVYCQPPRPAGRGQAVRRCPVHEAAEALGLPVRTPTRLRDQPNEHASFSALGLDAAVVVAYGLILPGAMLMAPAFGCLNIHASLLPRWRGAAPIQAAILAGDTESGVTIMRMDAGLDTGPMLLSQAMPITPETTGASLHDALAALGADLITRVLAEWPTETPQPKLGVTYAPKLSREDARINWCADAATIERRIRAFTPWPGTVTTLDATALKILSATVVPGHGVPGRTLDAALTVACGKGALRLDRVQLAGRAAMDAAAFLRGHKVPAGTILT
jgi:methionyl-tRNA formyltransferase